MTIADAKRRREVPCLYLRWNERKNCDELWPAAVDCSLDCKGCGFDPSEQARRLRDGTWVCDHKGVRRLVFKPAAGGRS